ncbi:MAG: hypothetical protein E6767_00480 [Dysgonomonas sp.]|nr:hypothetical protein [Dysgonomonas sp.]
MDIQELYQLIKKDKSPDIEDVESLGKLVEEYPYFQAAIFAYLKAVYMHKSIAFKDELTKFSIFINDRRALFYYIFSEEYDLFFKETGKTEVAEDKTSLLLDAFFESKGNDENSALGLEYSISHSSMATTDYFTYIEAISSAESGLNEEKESATLKHQDIIDSFINKSEEEGIRIYADEEKMDNASAPDLETDDELEEDIFFTETLAKIYVKQKKYEKAYKIIKHLSLNYPKKNIYFADQLSFLEKLIINSKHKDTK